MGKNNMTDGMNMKNSLLKGPAVLLIFFLSVVLYAQDPLPRAAVVSRPTVVVKDSRDSRQPKSKVKLSDSMPNTFKGTRENVISDSSRVLFPFFEKLSLGREPVRIVHIGDSHIRGHVLPLTVRRNFERDFGDEATMRDTITYFSSGIARETGKPGVVYHIIGINGATCANFTNPMQAQEIGGLKPDLIIVSFGTNESYGHGYNPVEHERRMSDLLHLLNEYCPNAAVLLTTPPGSYIRYRRRRSVNTRTPLVARTIEDYANKNGYACWDLYGIAGGRGKACLNWVNGNYMVRDRVHYTVAGYALQGNLLYEALIKAYNGYVAN